MAKQQKVKLGNTPKNFTKTVDVVLLNGTVAGIDISYIYRTRAQFAELFDQRIAKEAELAEQAKLDEADAGSADADAVAGAANKKTMVEWFKIADADNAKYILEIADGWDLDEPFTEQSLLQLEDENPGALASIAAIYSKAVAEVRTKK